jgi:hypothetical protein
LTQRSHWQKVPCQDKTGNRSTRLQDDEPDDLRWGNVSRACSSAPGNKAGISMSAPLPICLRIASAPGMNPLSPIDIEKHRFDVHASFPYPGNGLSLRPLVTLHAAVQVWPFLD